MIVPSIDLMDGKAVQLRQGKEKVLENDDVIGLAREFGKYGELAVIDLDAALGRGDNRALIKELCKVAECRVGGGIRSVETANQLLAAGAKKVIIGTAATPAFLSQLPRDRVIVAVDSRGGYVVNNGWTNKTGKTPGEMMRELEGYCSEFLFTDVDREGLMKGFNADMVRELKENTRNQLTVAGGVATIENIRTLEDLNLNSQIGMALYTERIKLDDAFISLLKFDGNGMIPTIVQDENGRVLMLAYSSRESLEATFRTNKATYYSRSRRRLWTKGGTSGNTQEFLRIRYDCDRDALLLTVRQKNFACHTGRYSCFGDKGFKLEDLYEVIRGRINSAEPGSYTYRIALDEAALKEKIREEAGEVIGYTDRDNLVWEIADLAYFLLVLMARNGISPAEIVNELWRRRK